MIQSREQALESVKNKLAANGHRIWSADDDTNNTLVTVDCYSINGQQIALHQQFYKSYTGRKVDYKLQNWTLFLPLESTGRIEDESRKLDQLIQQVSQEFSRQPA